MINSFKKSLEKNAGAVGAAVEKVLKTMWKYPKTTLGVAITTAAGLSMADKIHPLHQIASEERKRGLMKDQRSLLKGILDEHRKGNVKKPVSSGQKLIKQPLS